MKGMKPHTSTDQEIPHYCCSMSNRNSQLNVLWKKKKNNNPLPPTVLGTWSQAHSDHALPP